MTIASEPPLSDDKAMGMPRPRKSRKWLWIFLLIPTAVIGAILLFVGAIALFIFTGQDEPVTAQDRAIIVDIHSLANWIENYTPSPQEESIKKTRYMDGSYDVEYEYSLPDDTDGYYLACTVTVENSAEDASYNFFGFWKGFELVATGLGVNVEERNDLFQWGDHSRFAVLKTEGQPVGNMFITRTDKYIFSIILSGVYFTDTESINDLLLEKLERLPSYSS